MQISDFLHEFQDIIQSENIITTDTKLSDLEEWDSMATMSLMAWLEMNLQITVTFAQLASLQSVEDIINLSQGKIA